MVCKHSGLIKTGDAITYDNWRSIELHNRYVHDNKLDVVGPLLPIWIINPYTIADKTHKERIEILHIIEDYYHRHYLSEPVYNVWMNLNNNDYQLGNNDDLLKLWDDRLPIKNLDVNQILNNIDKGNRIKMRDDKSDDMCNEFVEMCEKKHMRLNYQCVKLTECINGGYHVTLFNVTNRKQVKILNHLFPWGSHEDKQKTNLDFASLVFQACKSGKTKEVNLFLRHISVGLVNCMATGLLIMALGNKVWPYVSNLIKNDQTCCMNLESHKTYFKAISVAIRRTSRWPDGKHADAEQVANLAYTELSIGRSINKVDWEDEKKKRIGPVLPLINPYDKTDFLIYVERVLENLMSTFLPIRDEWGSWAEFCMSRQNWAPSGSSGGAKLRIDGHTYRINKHSYFEMTTFEEMNTWLDQPGCLKAKGSDKMETGKSRAIYGTLPQDQAVTAYVIKPLEKRMQKCSNFIVGHNGAHEVADIGLRLYNVSGDRVECTMLDYADFNYQHTLEAQALIFKVLKPMLIKYNNSDLNKANSWVENAQLNQYVQFPLDKQWYKVTQGLFSGVRSTDFTNTILNYAYYEASKMLLYEQTGLKPIDEFHLHKGDDVWVTNKSRLWAAQLYKQMQNTNFVFQASKQMFDQNRGEFLRVIYTRDGAIGYVMRSVATLIMKPIQSVNELAPQGKSTALTSQIHLLFRRGINVETCNIIWWAIIPNALKLKLPGRSGVNIPISIAGKSYAEGGLDLGPPMTLPTHNNLSTAAVPAPISYTKELAGVVPRNMSHDWIKVISEQVQDKFDASKLEDALHDSNVSDSLRTCDRLKTMRTLEKELKLWNEKIKKTQKNRKQAVRRQFTIDENLNSHIALMLTDKMYGQLESIIASGNDKRVNQNIVATLTAGIAMSPFRDLSSAKLALGLSNIDSARECLKLAGFNNTTRKASGWLENLIRALGPDVTTCILQGIRGVGPSYESMLHPVVLSWLCKRATDYAIMDAITYSIRDVGEWQLLLDDWMTKIVMCMISRHSLDKWSHY